MGEPENFVKGCMIALPISILMWIGFGYLLMRMGVWAVGGDW